MRKPSTRQQATVSPRETLRKVSSQNVAESTGQRSSPFTPSGTKRSRRAVKDTVSNIGTFEAVAPNLPPEFYHVHKWLSPILGSSCETLMELVSRCSPYPDKIHHHRLSPPHPFSYHATTQDMDVLENVSRQIHLLLQIIIDTGHAQQWSEFSRWADLHTRILGAIPAKKANEERAVRDAVDAESSWLGYAKGSWLPLTEEQLSQDCWKGPVDQEYLRNLYRGAMEPVDFDWDNGASSNEERNAFVDRRLLPMDPAHFDWKN